MTNENVLLVTENRSLSHVEQVLFRETCHWPDACRAYVATDEPFKALDAADRRAPIEIKFFSAPELLAQHDTLWDLAQTRHYTLLIVDERLFPLHPMFEQAHNGWDFHSRHVLGHPDFSFSMWGHDKHVGP